MHIVIILPFAIDFYLLSQPYLDQNVVGLEGVGPPFSPCRGDVLAAGRQTYFPVYFCTPCLRRVLSPLILYPCARAGPPITSSCHPFVVPLAADCPEQRSMMPKYGTHTQQWLLTFFIRPSEILQCGILAFLRAVETSWEEDSHIPIVQ